MAIQPGTGITSMHVVKDGGKVIPISGDQFMPQRNITIEQLPYHVDIKDELVHFMNKIASDEVKLFIEQTYSFERGLEALQKTSTRRARGKLVITIP